MKKWIWIAVLLLAAPGPAALAQLSNVHGFVEGAAGARISDGEGAHHDDLTLLETRLQLKTRHFFENGYLAEKSGIFDFKAEALEDGYFDGKVTAMIRECDLTFSPFSIMDVKVGRQVLTWGTGDFLFINDMFPKDYVSFFSGRADEYLKKPSDALKGSLYFKPVNIDMVVLPWFEPNTTPNGDRLSFYDAFQGGIVGGQSDRSLITPSRRPKNMEYALRAFRQFGSYEAAAYFFHGFYNNPNSYKNEAARELFYPRVDVYGASFRGPVAGGIGNVEVGYDRSRQDPDGNNRLIQNSSFKAMAGYSRDLGHDWSIGLQYQWEEMLDYHNYEANLLPTDLRFDEYRQVLTQRITKLFKSQTVRCSLFNFYSPSDQDGYLRASVSYDWTDRWNVTTGVNLPWGEDDYTEFGQMRKDKNIFVRVRYNF